jgi:hypothetical protein
MSTGRSRGSLASIRPISASTTPGISGRSADRLGGASTSTASMTAPGWPPTNTGRPVSASNIIAASP